MTGSVSVQTCSSFDEVLNKLKSAESANSGASPYAFFLEGLPDAKGPSQAYFFPPGNASSSGDSLHVVVYTHGSGGDCTSPTSVQLCQGIAGYTDDSGSAPPLAVLAFNGSMNLKGRATTFEKVIAWVATSDAAATISLAGRSMGCRAAAMAYVASASTCEKLSGQLVFGSYPLVGNGEAVRRQVIIDLPETARMLLIAGTEDPMCPPDTLAEFRNDAAFAATSAVLSVIGADHGMGLVSGVKVEGGKKKAAEQLGKRAGELAGQFLLSGQPESDSDGRLEHIGGVPDWSGWQPFAKKRAESMQDNVTAVVHATASSPKPVSKKRRKADKQEQAEEKVSAQSTSRKRQPTSKAEAPAPSRRSDRRKKA